FTVNSPLTGLYSRPGWNHPGPIMFWAMAPLSWATGHAPWATRIGGAVMQAVALAWLGVATARRGIRWLLAAGLVCSCTYLASDQWLFREPWNLHIPVPFFIVFLFLTVFVARGESRQLVGMSIAATIVVSTHLGYAPLVIVGFAYAAMWMVIDARRTGVGPPRFRRTVGWCALVWGVTWAAPVLDLVLHWSGNLGKIVSYFAAGHASVGLGDAVRFTADEFRWVPPWIGGAHRIEFFTGHAVPASPAWLMVPLVMVVVATVAVRSSRDRDDARLLGLAVLMVVVGVLAISGADEPRAYTFQWRAVLAAFLATACLSSVVTVVLRRARRAGTARRAMALVTVAAIAGSTIAMTVAVVRGPSQFLAYREPDLQSVVSRIDRWPRPRGPVRVRAVGSSLPSLSDGVVNELDRRGVDVRVDPELGRIFGADRTIARSADVETWFVTEDGSRIPELLALPGARLLAARTPLSPGRERELADLQARIGKRLAATAPGRTLDLDSTLFVSLLTGTSGIPARDLHRLRALDAAAQRDRRCRCAVVVVPPRRVAAARGT
ncbi:MAG: hypothetical protein ABJC79_06090, partial [Acidimicrobiia bacterium]